MKCKTCGTELKTDAKFCPGCGSKVVAEKPAETGSASANSSNNSKTSYSSAEVFRPSPDAFRKMFLWLIFALVATVAIMLIPIWSRYM